MSPTTKIVKLTPSKLLTYTKCPRRMRLDIDAQAPLEKSKEGLVPLLSERRMINRRICEKALLSQGRDITPSQTFSTEFYAAKVDFSEITSDTVRLYHVTLSTYSGEETYFTKAGDPNYEHKPLFIRAAFCHKVLSELYPDKRVESHILAFRSDEPMPLNGLSFYRLRDDIWGMQGDVSEECFRYIVDTDISGTCLRYMRGELNVCYKTTLDNAIERARMYLDGDIPACEITHACGNCAYKDRCLDEAYPSRDKGAHTIFEINSFNYMEKNKLLKTGKYLMSEVPGEKLNTRQVRQIEATLSRDSAPRFDAAEYVRRTSELVYPLHCIDFETAVFPGGTYKNTCPMKGVSYQFSEHILDRELNIIGHREYINLNGGDNPTVEFVRALKKALSGDMGTPVIYSKHENTYLCFAYEQILREKPADMGELLTFLRSITTPTEDLIKVLGGETWTPAREMFDLLELVRDCFYQRDMKSSYSIKSVLPAILTSSGKLREIWSGGYNGTNLHRQRIVELNGDSAVSPYSLLPKFSGIELKRGDDALEYYAEAILGTCDAARKEDIRKAALAYCEMDTLAEVILLQGLKELCRGSAATHQTVLHAQGQM